MSKIPHPSDGSEADGSKVVLVQIPPQLVQKQLDKIVTSSTFTQSQRLIRFLRFIVEQLLKNEADQLKEYRLGVSVFDRDESYDPRTDPIVRVEASRLRTKLREYYDLEGKDDPVLIEMPKGSYAPIVTMRALRPDAGGAPSPGLVELRRRSRPFLLAFVILVSVVSASLALYFYLQNREIRKELLTRQQLELPAPEFRPIWSRFFTPGVETYVVFGSPVFFASPDNRLFLRSYDIREAQGLEDNATFQQLRQRFGMLTGPRYDYALLGEVLAVHRLTDFMVRNGGSLTALPAYKTTWDAIQTGNIILLGAPRMNHLLRHFPRQLDFEWDSEENIRNRRPQPGESAVYAAKYHEGFLDRQPDAQLNGQTYAIVACLPGLRPDREILVVSVHGGPGLWEAVDYLTRRETLRPLLSQLRLSDSSGKQYFQMLLRIYVDRGIPIRTEYVTHHLTPGT